MSVTIRPWVFLGIGASLKALTVTSPGKPFSPAPRSEPLGQPARLSLGGLLPNSARLRFTGLLEVSAPVGRVSKANSRHPCYTML